MRCPPVAYSLLPSFHWNSQKGQLRMCFPLSMHSSAEVRTASIEAIEDFQTCSLRKNLHLNCSLQFLGSFPRGMFMALFSLVLTKFNFITSALLHLVVSRRGTSFYKIETFKVVLSINPSFKMHYFFILNSYLNICLETYQVSMSNIETQSLEILFERILAFLHILSTAMVMSRIS